MTPSLTSTQIWVALVITAVLLLVLYRHIGIDKIKSCYGLWLTKKYWTDYNIVEAISWCGKALIIVPGLIFGIQLWWLYFITLFTSITLIWASNKKLLPTLVGFNSLWVWLSVMALVREWL